MKDLLWFSFLMIFSLQVSFSKLAIADGKFAASEASGQIVNLHKIVLETQAEATQGGPVEWSEKTWNDHFSSEADKAYFEKLRLRLVQTKHAIPGLKIVQEKNAVVILNNELAPIHLTLDTKIPGSLFVNGVQIKTGEFKSGKELFEKIVKIIDAPKKKNAWFSLLVPDAQAVAYLAVFAVALLIAGIGLKVWSRGKNAISDKLKTLKETCEKQEVNVPYAQSQTKKAYDLLLGDAKKYKDYIEKAKHFLPQIKDGTVECLETGLPMASCQLLTGALSCHEKFRKSKDESYTGETSPATAQ